MFARAMTRANMKRLTMLGLLFLFPFRSFAESETFQLESIGARAGVSLRDGKVEYKEAAAFAFWNLPTRWDLFWNLQIQLRVDAAAGWLSGRGDDGAFVSGGPSGVLQRPGWPISLEAGSSPTLMTRDEFGSDDFGTLFQFTSHLGVNVDLGRHWRLSYRLQHMSNGHISDENPGLSMHMVGASWRF